MTTKIKTKNNKYPIALSEKEWHAVLMLLDSTTSVGDYEGAYLKDVIIVEKAEKRINKQKAKRHDNKD